MKGKTFVIIALLVFGGGLALMLGAGDKGNGAQVERAAATDPPAEASTAQVNAGERQPEAGTGTQLEAAAGPNADMQAAAEPSAQTAANAEAAARDAENAVIATQLPTYPLLVCPVSKKKLGSMGDPVNFVHEGRLVRFCCAGCEDEFLKNSATYFETIDLAVIGTQIASYPLKECPVSGQPLGSMGEPHNHIHGTRLVRFCCDGCLDEFAKDPAMHVAKIDAAAAGASGQPPEAAR